MYQTNSTQTYLYSDLLLVDHFPVNLSKLSCWGVWKKEGKYLYKTKSWLILTLQTIILQIQIQLQTQNTSSAVPCYPQRLRWSKLVHLELTTLQSTLGLVVTGKSQCTIWLNSIKTNLLSDTRYNSTQRKQLLSSNALNCLTTFLNTPELSSNTSAVCPCIFWNILIPNPFMYVGITIWFKQDNHSSRITAQTCTTSTTCRTGTSTPNTKGKLFANDSGKRTTFGTCQHKLRSNTKT